MRNATELQAELDRIYDSEDPEREIAFLLKIQDYYKAMIIAIGVSSSLLHAAEADLRHSMGLK